MDNNMPEILEALQHRIEELEIESALQSETIQSLSDTIARIQQTLDLQQAQLRLLYLRLPDKIENGNEPFNPANEIPPHYWLICPEYYKAENFNFRCTAF